MTKQISKKNTFDFDGWAASDFLTARPFKQHLDKLKSDLIGVPVSSIHIMGTIFNNYDHEDLDTWDAAGHIELDEPVVLICKDIQLEIWFYNTSHAKIGINTLTMSEKSYQGESWRNVSGLFPNIIGQKIREIKLRTFSDGFYDSVFIGDGARPTSINDGSRPDGGDYFGSLLIVLENDFVLELCGEIEYMWVSECAKVSIRLFPTHSRVRVGEDARGCLEFVPYNEETELREKSIGIGEDDWDTLHWTIRHFFPDYDMYECDYPISISDWERIMGMWRFVFYAESFDEVFEQFCGLDYSTNSAVNSGLLYYINHTGYVWKNRDSAWEIYMDFQDWFERVKNACTHIHIYGM